jgi:signal recognition particle GTPase
MPLQLLSPLIIDLGIDGLVVTKLDVMPEVVLFYQSKQLQAGPVKFVGMGEKLDALEPFHPRSHGFTYLRHGRCLVSD